MLASLLAAGMPLGAQNLGSEYRLKRVIPVEGRQGVAADSNFYYVSGSTALYKYDKQGRLAAKNERPFEGLPLAANHIGDIDVWDGEIYAGIETFDDGRGENIQVAVYDANTLKWKRSIDWEPSSGQVEVCGLAVDRDGDMVWMADWVDGRYVYGYNRKTGRYVRKVHLRPVPQWQQEISSFFKKSEKPPGARLHGPQQHIQIQPDDAFHLAHLHALALGQTGQPPAVQTLELGHGRVIIGAHEGAVPGQVQ